MEDTSPTTQREGRIGCGILLWLLGVPLPVVIILLLVIYGC